MNDKVQTIHKVLKISYFSFSLQFTGKEDLAMFSMLCENFEQQTQDNAVALSKLPKFQLRLKRKIVE